MNTQKRDAIVCGFDLSTTTDDIVDVAARLAERLGGRIVLCHATPIPLHGEGARSATLRGAVDDVTAALPAAVAAEVIVEDAGVSDLLTRTAGAVGASFVVVGAGGVAGPKRRISRGVRGLVRVSPSPVLVLQGTAVIDSWLRGERTLVVAVAAAFDDKLHHLVEMVRVLRRVGACDIVVIHTSFPPAEAERLHAPPPAHVVENDTPVQTLVGSDLAKIFSDLPGVGAVRVVVQPVIGRDDAYIDHAARDAKADLIVIGSHQRHGLDRLIHGSTDDGVLELSSADVLVVPLHG